MNYADSFLLLAGVYVVSLVSPGPNFIIVTSTSTSTSMSVSRIAAMGAALIPLGGRLLLAR